MAAHIGPFHNRIVVSNRIYGYLYLIVAISTTNELFHVNSLINKTNLVILITK